MNRAQYHYYQFWLYVWVITIASISFGCGCTFQVYPRLMYSLFELNFFHLQESICHQMLGEEADRRYGEHRLWASVGWGLMAAVSGYLVDLDSEA